MITIKKSDWLSLLDIKKSWEKTFSSVSDACTVPPIVTTLQPTSAHSTAGNSERRTSAPVPAIPLPSATNSSNKSSPSPNAFSSKSSSSPFINNSKSHRENKKKDKVK
ncbi:hypothetical protein AVEN_124647-1 [Araneus ventricosus]|uniref:Uncharacterized protein n=1 Tax=Araneus ventricosus TaxID=182803 RepID=A0A4Y2VIV5_ARAVE|nr:hypothetical protein AVEN_124647-1 [Araneus ventricosus]